MSIDLTVPLYIILGIYVVGIFLLAVAGHFPIRLIIRKMRNREGSRTPDQKAQRRVKYS